MEKFDRLYQLHQLLSGRRTAVSTRQLAESLECSEKTVKRYIDQFRDYYAAPIENVWGQGWRYLPGEQDSWELPGLWLTESELQSLLLLLDMLARFSNGLLSEELSAINKLIDRLLQSRGIKRSEIDKKVKIIPIGHQTLPDKRLHSVFTALILNQQIMISYRDFQGQSTVRNISPQRLVYYRDNWYIDSWCHKREALRTFSLSRIKRDELQKTKSISVNASKLDAYFTDSYGMFSGKAKNTAILRFFPTIAHEVARQHWHPEQQGEWAGEDYLLKIPYSDDRELIQDIQRYHPNVTVEAPPALCNKVKRNLYATLKLYDDENKRN